MGTRRSNETSRIAASPLSAELTPAGCTVLSYVSRQRMRFCQHIPQSEIVEAADLPDSVAAAGLVECVAQGLLSAAPQVEETVYSLVAQKPRPVAETRH